MEKKYKQRLFNQSINHGSAQTLRQILVLSSLQTFRTALSQLSQLNLIRLQQLSPPALVYASIGQFPLPAMAWSMFAEEQRSNGAKQTTASRSVKKTAGLFIYIHTINV